MTAPAAAVSPRRALMAKVHVAKKALKLDDDTYRALLAQKFGVSSAADLRDDQLVGLVEYFKSKGFKPSHKPPVRASAKKLATRPEAAGGGELRKIRALWLSLYHLGVISEPSEKALVAFAKRSSGGAAKGIDALQWLDGGSRYKVIEALKAWAVREGHVHWTPYKDRAGNVIGHNDRGRVIEAQWMMLGKLKVGFTFIDVRRAAENDMDRLIEEQGAEIRRAKAVLL